LGLVALRRLAAFVGAGIRSAACCALLAGAAGEPGAARVEARSENLLAVGIVSADRMSIHLTRVVDNAPVRDAVLTVLLRGISHPTIAEADGSYVLQTGDLALPGPASLEFQVTQGAARQDLKGTLLVAGGAKPEDKNSARQLWWWVLNFAVCIGFLMLISRRRRSSRPGKTSD
jgi:hypothetical protein